MSIMTGSQNSKCLKHWANDELGLVSDLFYRTKILPKTLKRVSLHKTLKMDLIFMNLSNYRKSTLVGPMTKQFVLQPCFFNVLPRINNLDKMC